ncbi:DUF5681 domain-containing protein [Magnetofaba australis]|uniref:DUF5681 domain-containing protein n=1 Tax=Magnetofaba australis TaxID=1472297 RepID=UPI0039C94756
MSNPEKTGPQQVERIQGRFPPGRSGNPKGRPPGSGKTALLRARLLEGCPEVVEMLIERAREGDVQAARIILDKVLPNLKPEATGVSLPLLDQGSLSDRGESVLGLLASAEIGPEQASKLLSVLVGVARLHEVTELAKRIEVLETTQKRPLPA